MKLITDLGMQYATPNSSRKRRYGLYLCPSCNQETRLMTTNVKSKKTTKCISCANTIHGETTSSLYRAWVNMRERCKGTTPHYEKYYASKSIYVCQEWENSYETFRDWSIANGYAIGLTLDKDCICEKNKISPKRYSPETCQWVTQKENNEYKNKKDLEC